MHFFASAFVDWKEGFTGCRVCVYICVCIMYARVYAYVMCGHDEPFSYLISFYSSSRIVLFVIARTAQCFRFRYTVTFQLSVYLATLCCVSTTRQEKHGVVGRSRNRAKLTSKESQEKNESMPFPFFLSFFSYLLAFLSHRIRASIDISRHFLFQGGPEKTVGTKLAGTRFERQSDSCAQSKGGRGWRRHRSRPPDCDKTRIEFYSQPRNSIRDEVVVSARNEPNP